jgi:phosphoenolpyruvate synthase/pyruvate phosphate dikinase
MKKLALFAVSAAVLVSSTAFAQGLTRAEVRQQLVEAQQNGSEYVTDASYPDVSPAFKVSLPIVRKALPRTAVLRPAPA